jgi:hypothetical protein
MSAGVLFRKWLAERLRGTEFAKTRIPDDKLDAVAKMIGVDPDLLLEVRARARIERGERGRAPSGNNALRVLSDRVYEYHLFMPPVIFAAWKAECSFRGVEGSMLLRSLIHEYLSATREPQPMPAWIWQGEMRPMGDNPKRAKCMERAAIPKGARRALVRRAELLGVRPTSIVRALATEVLAGDHRDVTLLGSGSMFDDETRYFMGPSAPPGDGLDRGHVPR